jgi:hypothetical protein
LEDDKSINPGDALVASASASARQWTTQALTLGRYRSFMLVRKACSAHCRHAKGTVVHAHDAVAVHEALGGFRHFVPGRILFYG